MRCWTFFVLTIIIRVQGEVEDVEKNHLTPKQFRLQKFNFAWDKAQLRLDDYEQQRLFVELTKLDKEALKAKHDYASGKSGDFSLIDLLDKKFLNLLKQYKLYDVIASLEERKSSGRDEESVSKAFDKKSPHFIDLKLNKLWLDAQKSGFSEQELDELFVEFQHHELKLDRMKKEEEDFSKHEDNSVSTNFDEKDADQLERNKKFKFQRKEADEDFLALVNKIEKEKVRSADGEFTHPKVKFIWEKALSSSPKRFTEQELNSLKEELKHFENKLNKLTFVENELIKTKYHMNKLGKDNIKTNEQKELETKYKEYERKIEKMEFYLKSKLVHTEL